MENNIKRERLKEFYFKIKDCQLCELYKSRTNFVFGSGNANSPVIFIGEAPGKNEDIQGKPFVGQAGKLLDELLFSIELERSEIFIANILKCRPPGNRDPRIEEINICKNHLFKQIEIIDPKLICTMGKFSTQLILNTSAGITGLRGKIFMVNSRAVLPINHPAAALYTPSRMVVLREDFQKIKKVLGMKENFTDGIENIEDLEVVDYSSSGSTLRAGGDESSISQNKDEQLGLF